VGHAAIKQVLKMPPLSLASHIAMPTQLLHEQSLSPSQPRNEKEKGEGPRLIVQGSPKSFTFTLYEQSCI